MFVSAHSPLWTKHRERISLGAAIVALALALAYAFTLSGHSRSFFLYYNVPIAAPFAVFVIERTLGRERGWVIDGSVVALAIARAFLPLGGFSGHVLFTGYASLAARTRTGRISARLVLLEVLIVKLGLWGDFWTPLGGVLIALAAWWILRQVHSAHREHGRLDWLVATFATFVALTIALGYYRQHFDAERWQNDPASYRSVRSARAAAHRVRGVSAGEACQLLTGELCPVSSGTSVFHYELNQPCAYRSSDTDCVLAVRVVNERVVAAWLDPGYGQPASIECLYGCREGSLRDLNGS